MPLNSKPIILLDNLLSDGTPYATDTDADTDYNILNVIDLKTYSLHKFASVGTKYITVDSGAVQAADALGVINHNHNTADADISIESGADVADDPAAGELSNSGLGAWTAANLVDDNNGTKGFDVDAAGAGSYFKIDLGVAGDLEFTRARLYVDGVVSCLFNIQYSDDDIDYTGVAFTGMDLSGGAGWKEAAWHQLNVGAHRYWRFYKTDAAVAGADVMELQLYTTTWTERLAAFTPAADSAYMKIFDTASAQYWRIKIVTSAVVAYTGVIILGTRLTFPRYPSNNFDPDAEAIKGLTARSLGGNFLASVIEAHIRVIDLSFRNLTPAWVTANLMPIWSGHIKLLKPFFLAWDITNHATEVYFVKVKDRYSLKLPYTPARRSLKLQLEGISE